MWPNLQLTFFFSKSQLFVGKTAVRPVWAGVGGGRIRENLAKSVRKRGAVGGANAAMQSKEKKKRHDIWEQTGFIKQSWLEITKPINRERFSLPFFPSFFFAGNKLKDKPSQLDVYAKRKRKRKRTPHFKGKCHERPCYTPLHALEVESNKWVAE